MQKVITSAPGKLMLFGDHAVVHGEPCIVTAIDQRITVGVEKDSEDNFSLSAPDVGLQKYSKSISSLTQHDVPKAVAFLENLLKVFFERHPQVQGVKVETTSQFSSSFGFGSSSAVTVAFARALSELYEVPMTNKELFDLAYEAVLRVQGVGSGFDIASAIWGGTIYYVKPAAIVDTLQNEIPLIIGYTGVKADTATLVRMVGEMKDREPEKVETIFKEIGEVTEAARIAIKAADWDTVGRLMNQNQSLLAELNVSSEELDSLITAATDAGAYGAKLSGAGGGDCMVALGPNRSEIESAITSAGGEVMSVTPNAEGVRVEAKE